MDLANIPLFAMLRGRLGHLSERQRVISENVANASTAGYTPRDLTPFAFASQVQAARASAQATTQPRHLVAAGAQRLRAAGGARSVRAPGSQTTLAGNPLVPAGEAPQISQ